MACTDSRADHPTERKCQEDKEQRRTRQNQHTPILGHALFCWQPVEEQAKCKRGQSAQVMDIKLNNAQPLIQQFDTEFV